jgi:hypothetical protein
MLVLRVNEDQTIECITCWAECSTETFQNICELWEPEKKLEERNPVLLFSILTGMNFKVMLTTQNDEIESAIYQCVAFVYQENMSFMNEKRLKVMKIDGKIVDVPENLGSLTVEQNMHIRRALDKAKTIESLISLACAVYLQPLVDGTEFDYARAKVLEEEIKKKKIWETYQIGFFFLSKLRAYGKPGLQDLSLLKQMFIKKGWRLQSWLKSKSLTRSTT